MPDGKIYGGVKRLAEERQIVEICEKPIQRLNFKGEIERCIGANSKRHTIICVGIMTKFGKPCFIH